MAGDTEEGLPVLHDIEHTWSSSWDIASSKCHMPCVKQSLCALGSQENDFRVAETVQTSRWSLASQWGKVGLSWKRAHREDTLLSPSTSLSCSLFITFLLFYISSIFSSSIYCLSVHLSVYHLSSIPLSVRLSILGHLTSGWREGCALKYLEILPAKSGPGSHKCGICCGDRMGSSWVVT